MPKWNDEEKNLTKQKNWINNITSHKASNLVEFAVFWFIIYDETLSDSSSSFLCCCCCFFVFKSSYAYIVAEFSIIIIISDSVLWSTSPFKTEINK